MKPLSEINFHYERAVTQAERLEEASARLERAADRSLENLLDETYRTWRSEAANQYLKKGQKVEEGLQSAAENLRKTAKNIRAVAERIRAAELEARRIANENN